jgi:MFS family permease
MARHLLHRDHTDIQAEEDQGLPDERLEERQDERPSIIGRQLIRQEQPVVGHQAAAERYGGVSKGAVFFGWMVAVGVTILLSGILGAVAAAIGETADLTRDDLEGQAGDLGVGAAVALMVVLFIGYCCGGYVAGRMSRFDGARQGFAVWLLGLFVTLVAVGLGALFGSQYDVLDRVDLPRVPWSDGELTVGGAIAGVLVLAVTLIGALLGGAMGHRYHVRVDRVAHPE